MLIEEGSDAEPIELPERVVCFDVDGNIVNVYCNFPDFPNETAYLERLYELNINLARHVIDQRSKYSKTTLCSFTFRHDVELNDLNMETNQSASGFSILLYFAFRMGITFDPFLMTDLFQPLYRRAGATLADAMNPERCMHVKYKLRYDQGKFFHLYVLAHRAKASRPYKRMVLDIYDDRVDYLKELYNFYSAYPELLPEGLTLRFFHHGELWNPDTETSEFCDECSQYGEDIYGAGFVNPNYPAWAQVLTRLPMAMQAYGDPDRNRDVIQIRQHVLKRVLIYTAGLVHPKLLSKDPSQMASPEEREANHKLFLLKVCMMDILRCLPVVHSAPEVPGIETPWRLKLQLLAICLHHLWGWARLIRAFLDSISLMTMWFCMEMQGRLSFNPEIFMGFVDYAQRLLEDLETEKERKAAHPHVSQFEEGLTLAQSLVEIAKLPEEEPASPPISPQWAIPVFRDVTAEQTLSHLGLSKQEVVACYHGIL